MPPTPKKYNKYLQWTFYVDSNTAKSYGHTIHNIIKNCGVELLMSINIQEN